MHLTGNRIIQKAAHKSVSSPADAQDVVLATRLRKHFNILVCFTERGEGK